MFTIGWIHLAILAHITLIGYYCSTLTGTVEQATKLVRAIGQLMREVRDVWRQ